jgi:glycosyl transferase family 25
VVGSVPVYAINLARSQDRWDALRASADAFSIDIRRVEAVEGKLLAPEELTDLDETNFRRWHGKIPLPAEIGCYFSHIRALETIIAENEPFAVIIEDDVEFTPEFLPFLAAARKLAGWDIIKLVNHRTNSYRNFHTLGAGFTIGRCMHGPLGSSAAYIVTLEGAKRLLTAIKPMYLPYDVALERGWAGSYEIFTTNKPVVALSEILISTIAQGRQGYAKTRLPAYKRLTTLLFRATDYIRRIAYALRRNSLKEV